MTNEEQAKKVQERIDQARRSIALWRAEHDKHNDESSRRLLANALIYAAGAIDALYLVGLVDDAIREECDQWREEAHALQSAPKEV